MFPDLFLNLKKRLFELSLEFHKLVLPFRPDLFSLELRGTPRLFELRQTFFLHLAHPCFPAGLWRTDGKP